MSEVEVSRRARDIQLRAVRHALECICKATEMGGVTATKLAEMLCYEPYELHSAGLQRVANITFEAAHYVDPEGSL